MRAKLADTVQEHTYITSQAEDTETLADPMHGQVRRVREKSWSDGMFTAHGGEFFHGGEKPRVLELRGDAHGDREIVVAYPDDVHTGHGNDGFQILESLHRFQ